MTARPFRSGYVALVGRPNVGKSTLLNQILGQKLAIITPKPQTTRHRILGIKTLPDAQLLFIDTPGIHKARKALGRTMVRAAMSALADADVIVLLIDAQDADGAREEAILEQITNAREKVVVAINKIDRVPKLSLLPRIDAWSKRLPEAPVVPISALQGDGVDRLLQEILQRTPEGPAFYPPDQITDQPERFFVAEIIREKIYLFTGEEIPYSSAVIVDEFEEVPKRKLARIQATIYVERDSQKAIIIGKGGLKLKEIGSEARKDIEAFLGSRVGLSLWVKVDRSWTRDLREVRRLGY